MIIMQLSLVEKYKQEIYHSYYKEKYFGKKINK